MITFLFMSTQHRIFNTLAVSIPQIPPSFAKYFNVAMLVHSNNAV